ncbi:hypothetical protein [Candidatus Stoquefichus massiliensis]|uniref:hypothetical protein n=1 Tax=Candidatus Stoquefichus massiliensis TaxID=1470350 RepID=UPI0004BC571F|nr:hypothetical protein [Candidatus Stoquefichus massiliensis]
MKAFLKKYKNIKYLLIFLLIYMIGFLLLEKRMSTRTIMTSSLIDQYIPFNEYFVIPYLLWFAFIAFGFVYFIFIDQEGFQRTAFYLFTGMMISLLIYLIFPNGQDLRVELNNENVFQILVGFIYSIDSPTNVCPSIHVYNSLMMSISLMKSQKMKEHHMLCIFIIVLTFFICASTVLIKQHAFVDMIAAIVLALIIYGIGKKKWSY